MLLRMEFAISCDRKGHIQAWKLHKKNSVVFLRGTYNFHQWLARDSVIKINCKFQSPLLNFLCNSHYSPYT